MVVEFLVDAIESLLYVVFISKFLGYKRASAVNYLGFFIAAIALFLNIVIADIITFFHWSTILIDCIIIFVYARLFLDGSVLSYIIGIALFDLGLVGCVTITMGLSALIAPNGVETWMADGTLGRYFLLFVNKVLLIGYMYVILKMKKCLENNRSCIWNGMILTIPVLVIAMTSAIIPLLLSAYQEEKDTFIYVMLLAGIVILAVIALILVIYVMKKEVAARESKILKELLASQRSAFEKEIREFEKIRKIRHDMKNHLLGIKFYFDKGETTSGKEYLDRLLCELTGTTEHEKGMYEHFETLWGSMIDLKFAEANEKGIETNQKILPGRYEEIQPMDLCVILGNLLDNAIEAEERNKLKKTISITMEEKYRFIYIYIKNWVDDESLDDAKKLMSSKKDRYAHGLGIRNVEESIKQYKGKMVIEVEGNYFIVKVVIPLN